MDSTDTGILDFRIVLHVLDWPDNVIFDSTHPAESLPRHLQLSLSKGFPLPPIDSIQPTIMARETLPPGTVSKHFGMARISMQRTFSKTLDSTTYQVHS
jgi:hypothetical protein